MSESEREGEEGALSLSGFLGRKSNLLFTSIMNKDQRENSLSHSHFICGNGPLVWIDLMGLITTSVQMFASALLSLDVSTHKAPFISHTVSRTQCYMFLLIVGVDIFLGLAPSPPRREILNLQLVRGIVTETQSSIFLLVVSSGGSSGRKGCVFPSQSKFFMQLSA